jgi:(p)ppGpp synthase/HD superfamily hydrolase
MSSLVARARAFAIEAHSAINHKRKYTGDDYIVHPREVAAIVATVPHTDEMLAAAWLHDTVEDTGVAIETIRAEFGPIVAMYVADLTDVSTPDLGNRAVRKAIDLAHTAEACADAKTIKLADLLSNTASIVEHDPGFARVYLKEKAAMLEVMTEGDATLLARAKATLSAGLAKLDGK